MSSGQGLAPLAIVGMAARFPGARNVAEFWDNLVAGRESITQFSDEALRAEGYSEEFLAQPGLIKAGGVLPHADRFDASFFEYSAREAKLIDPQQRVLLELAWEAMEDAAPPVGQSGLAVGVYAGCGFNTYLVRNLVPHSELQTDGGDYSVLLGSDKDFLATRIGYKLDLSGPCITVQTACSTSLVAVHMACQALWSGECDYAIAGGVSLPVPFVRAHRHLPGGILSADGHCRSFDRAAAGTVSGAGAGLVVVARLDQALERRHTVRAVVRGSAVNNDGNRKAGFTAPGVDAQAAVIRDCLHAAGLRPSEIGYIEAHGTATPLGDAIELAALQQAFEGDAGAKPWCALGSVKSNIGHPDAAAGIAGLIKAVLAVQTGLIPPSLHCEQPTSAFAWDQSPFFVNTELRSWTSPHLRLAGVSSFGIGGTNAHVIVEQPLPQPKTASGGPQVLPLSAHSPAALRQMRVRLAEFLEQDPDVSLADAAFTLQSGRKMFAHRAVVIATSAAEAARALRSGESGAELTPALQNWLGGGDFTWPAADGNAPRRIGLPSYPFARQRYWVDPPVRRSWLYRAQERDRAVAPRQAFARIESIDDATASQGKAWLLTPHGATGLALAAEVLKQAMRLPHAPPIHLVAERGDPYAAAALALARIVQQEHPHIGCHLHCGDGPSALEAEATSVFEPLTPSLTLNSRLREGGCYLVTGGLGNIGLTLAEYLTGTVNAHVVLTTRSEQRAAESARLRTLREAGARVDVLELDLNDVNAVSRAADKFRWNGVFHAAGIADANAFRALTETGPEDFERHFAVKLGAAQNLASAAQRFPVDFISVQSSLSTELGGLGLGAYAAANRAMEVFAAEESARSGTPWLVWLWDSWQPESGGVALPLGSDAARITQADAPALFDALLERSVPARVLISPTDLTARQHRWSAPAKETAVPVTPLHARAESDVAYAAPATDTERAMQAIWQDLLGVAPIGLDDSFYDLGGDSLLATQLAARVRSTLGQELPLRSLFESPTIRESCAALKDPGESKPVAGPVTVDRSRYHVPAAVGSPVSSPAPADATPMHFSLMFFSADGASESPDKYRLVRDCARYADEHGFHAIWTPERHFHRFGGLFPRPATLSAMLAGITDRIALRAGSVTLPLDHPVRVAEEWSLVDNLSGGRAGLALGSGWNANDFILNPSAFAGRREMMFEGIDTLRKLWRGEAVAYRNGAGLDVEIKVLPRPLQAELPLWLVCISPDTFRRAGEAHAGVLTSLLSQDIDQLAQNVAAYRAARGHTGGAVTLMVHTLLGAGSGDARKRARSAYEDYVRSNLSLQESHSRGTGMGIAMDQFSADDVHGLLDQAAERMMNGRMLLGSAQDALPMVRRMQAAGVTEIACLVDFDTEPASVMQCLASIRELMTLTAATEGSYAG